MRTLPLDTKQFQRNTENFVCDQCGFAVEGDGYRNHCPHCLVSKHVDVNPGDRAHDCGGLMDVADIFLDHGKTVLRHRCRVCGEEKNNKVHPEDSIDVIIATMKQINEKK